MTEVVATPLASTRIRSPPRPTSSVEAAGGVAGGAPVVRNIDLRVPAKPRGTHRAGSVGPRQMEWCLGRDIDTASCKPRLRRAPSHVYCYNSGSPPSWLLSPSALKQWTGMQLP